MERSSRATGPGRAAAVLALAAWSALPATAETAYEIDLADAQSGLLRVSMEADCAAPPCAFQMPVWNATYQLRDFARFVRGVGVEDTQGRPVPVGKQAPSRWLASPSEAGRLRVEYMLRADRPGPFGAYADSKEVTLNLGQALLYPVASADAAATLRFVNKPDGFREALALAKQGDRYRAASYAALVDTPAHLSAFVERKMEVGGKPIRVTALGRSGAFNLDLLAGNVRRLFEAAYRLMGELPFDRYVVVYVFADVEGGGMEYRDGTVIFGPADCANCGMASLTAHEIFHLWNVKRIRPRSMEPVNFERAQPSPSLWFAEGVTSTYSRFLQAMAGLLSPRQFETQIEELINDYIDRPARLEQSAEEAGIDAWFELYPDYAQADRSVSYYLRGELIGHLLDLAIRHHSENQRSLDDVMRLLAARGEMPYADTDGVEEALVEVAGEAMRDEVKRLVRSPEPIEWERYLGYAGYTVERRTVETFETGLMLSGPPGQGVMVAAVTAGTPAEESGLRAGDRILRVGGKRPSGGVPEVRRRLEKAMGKKIEIEVARMGASLELTLEPRQGSREEIRLSDSPHADALARAIRRGWTERQTDGSSDGAPSE